MTLTPEQEAVALTLARAQLDLGPEDFPAAFIARAVLHFAEQANEARENESWLRSETVPIMQQALAERDALKADYNDLNALNLAITADNAALKADVARLQEVVDSRMEFHAWVKPEAATAPPETPE